MLSGGSIPEPCLIWNCLSLTLCSAASLACLISKPGSPLAVFVGLPSPVTDSCQPSTVFCALVGVLGSYKPRPPLCLSICKYFRNQHSNDDSPNRLYSLMVLLLQKSLCSGCVCRGSARLILIIKTLPARVHFQLLTLSVPENRDCLDRYPLPTLRSATKLGVLPTL